MNVTRTTLPQIDGNKQSPEESVEARGQQACVFFGDSTGLDSTTYWPNGLSNGHGLCNPNSTPGNGKSKTVAGGATTLRVSALEEGATMKKSNIKKSKRAKYAKVKTGKSKSRNPTGSATGTATTFGSATTRDLGRATSTSGSGLSNVFAEAAAASNLRVMPIVNVSGEGDAGEEAIECLGVGLGEVNTSSEGYHLDSPTGGNVAVGASRLGTNDNKMASVNG